MSNLMPFGPMGAQCHPRKTKTDTETGCATIMNLHSSVNTPAPLTSTPPIHSSHVVPAMSPLVSLRNAASRTERERLMSDMKTTDLVAVVSGLTEILGSTQPKEEGDREKASEILGEIGALDPRHFPIRTKLPEPKLDQYEVGFTVLYLLVQIPSRREPAVCGAGKHILHSLGIYAVPVVEGKGTEFWRRFHRTEQEVLLFYLSFNPPETPICMATNVIDFMVKVARVLLNLLGIQLAGESSPPKLVLPTTSPNNTLVVRVLGLSPVDEEEKLCVRVFELLDLIEMYQESNQHKDFISQLPYYELHLKAMRFGDNARAYMYLEKHLRKENSLEKQCETFFRALRFNFDYVDFAYELQEKPERIIEQSLQLEPSDPRLWVNLSTLTEIDTGIEDTIRATVNLKLKEPPVIPPSPALVSVLSKLGEWDKLDELLKRSPETNDKWEVSLGRCLFFLNAGKRDAFQTQFDATKAAVTSSIISTNYHQVYQYVLHLHMLQDLQDYSEHVWKKSSKELLDAWNKRLKRARDNFTTKKSIVELHRILLHMKYTASHSEAEPNYTLPSMLSLEYSILKLNCTVHPKFAATQAGIITSAMSAKMGGIISALSVREDVMSRGILARLDIQQAKGALAHMEPIDVAEKPFTAAIIKARAGQKVRLAYAVLLDSFHADALETLESTVSPSATSKRNTDNYACKAIHQYRYTLECGKKHSVYCMSRILDLWLNSGGKGDTDKTQIRSAVQIALKRISGDVWVPALPLLVWHFSKFGNYDNSEAVKSLIEKALEACPQSVWYLMETRGTANDPKRLSWTGILNSHKQLKELFDATRQLFVILNDISRLGEADNNESRIMPRVESWVTSQKSGPIVMCPTKSAFTSPFNEEAHRIICLKYQKLPEIYPNPVVTFTRSDGFQSRFICAPEGEMQKDAGVLQFIGLVNMSLAQNPEARQRRLAVPSYTCIPFGENRGGIVERLPADRLLYVWETLWAQEPSMCSDITTTLKRRITEPLLYKWFYQQFPDVGAWFEARVRFIRSVAVMSMVGYVIGLGNRHPSNLLLSQNGEVIHMDFNRIFWQPSERVPYRLTHNLQHAMGIRGLNAFSRISEITLSTLRTTRNRYALVNMLQCTQQPKNNEDINKRDKVLHLLQGRVSEGKLDVVAQVRRTIEKATDQNRLKEMYAEWAPWV
ncbi:serine/threonine-protein kinase atr [Pelomyxa schiedti]|nr:serine/threonine-protein kinase atr [Pelomyxa schiedti]